MPHRNGRTHARVRSSPAGMLAAAMLAVLAPGRLAAQSTARTDEPVAFFFAYTVDGALRDHFDEGYRRHLEWHAEHRDSLVWYAWDVLTGDRVGLFVDATVGASFAALDARVDPAGDGADFEATAGAFARTAFREMYRLRSDLSRGTPLEDRAPTPFLQVLTYDVRPGSQAGFESVVALLAGAAGGTRTPVFTTYELVDGASLPRYVVLVATEGFADLGRRPAGLGAVLRAELAGPAAQEALDRLDRAVVGGRSEIWRYRSDLSLIPG